MSDVERRLVILGLQEAIYGVQLNFEGKGSLSQEGPSRE